jgi:hypothetical protein
MLNGAGALRTPPPPQDTARRSIKAISISLLMFHSLLKFVCA